MNGPVFFAAAISPAESNPITSIKIPIVRFMSPSSGRTKKMQARSLEGWPVFRFDGFNEHLTHSPRHRTTPPRLPSRNLLPIPSL